MGVPDNCEDLHFPDGIDAQQLMENGKGDDDNTDMGMGMSMTQMGSNYFVMGDFIRPDKQFIELDEFWSCFTDETKVESTDNPKVKEMKEKAIYDCVMGAEVARREAKMGLD